MGDLVFNGKEKEFVLTDHSFEASAAMHRVGRFSYCIVNIASWWCHSHLLQVLFFWHLSHYIE